MILKHLFKFLGYYLLNQNKDNVLRKYNYFNFNFKYLLIEKIFD